MSVTLHHRTPSIKVNDARGLAVRQIAYLRTVAGETPVALVTRQQHDVAGRPVTQRDPRLSTPNLTCIFGLGGEPLKVDSVDAGTRLTLPGLAGERLRYWDGRGSHRRSTYDNQLRMLTLEEEGPGIVATFTYADALAAPDHNLRGQLIRQVDPVVALDLNSFSLHGQPIAETRTMADTGTFASSLTYSPLGVVLTQTDAGNHRRQMFYDITGQLKKSQLLLTPTGTWLPVLEDARYNAAGQTIEQKAGNKVVSTWTYDDANGRLATLTAGVAGQDLLQHLKYLYDPVGNVLRIDDLTFKPLHFKNQSIDGHREFTYNSLYQLTSATGHDATPGSDWPGLPQPCDPKNHLNYKQLYEYDAGGNLIELTHERAVGGYTHEMFIDPNSNRGVRRKEGEPDPDFDTLFDLHGNQLALYPGRSLHWNNRDQLASVTLVGRDDGPNDEEIYRYSQGARIFKRHEWQASTITHFRQVIYLQGLEIRTRDNGEELHVITLPGGRGNVRCLHWISKKPDEIEADQLRYSLDDPLGSSLMELDQHARLISSEGYYSFGGTAWLTADSALEVSYKTIRYSANEMDISGLYYYGLRYYAPWLRRWINPDPLGAVDGLNLYQMVGNNPINFVDDTGGAKTQAPQPPQHTVVSIGSASSSASSSRRSSATGNAPIFFGPDFPDPTTPPPMPVESWREWGKGMVLSAVNSNVGLTLLPVSTTTPVSAVVVGTILTAATQILIHATVFNPGWSPPGTWDPEGDGSLPPPNVTQAANSTFGMINASVTLAGAVAGVVLGPIVGGYVDEFRGTNQKKAKDKIYAQHEANTKNMLDIIESDIFNRMKDGEAMTQHTWTVTRNELDRIDKLISYSSRVATVMEKLDAVRPIPSGPEITSTSSSRRSSVFSQSSGSGSVRQRTQLNRTPLRSSNSSMRSARV